MIVSGDVQAALENPPYSFVITTVRQNGGVFSAVATNPNDQASVDAALPTVISDLAAQELDDTTTKTEVNAMIGTFNSGSAATIYFNALQAGLRNVVQNNTAIATFYPQMLNLLNDNANLYTFFLNFVNIAGNLTQANVETPSTDAQRRQVFQLAVLFSVQGTVQVLASAPR